MLEAIILGIVQGLTEFFPISSTAHLILFPWFFNWSGDIDTLTFDIALHAGTLIAVILYFWKDWIDIILRKRRLLGLIVIASIPAGIAGLLLNDIVEKSLRSPYIITISLIIIGILMLASEKMYKHKHITEINLYDAIVIGFLQAVALIPGVSRSGITISGGLLRGLEREESARFSFLLSTPIIAGATALHAKKLFDGAAEYNLNLFTAGLLVSAISGFVAIKFLLNFFKKNPLNIFAYYRFALALVIIIGIWLKG